MFVIDVEAEVSSVNCEISISVHKFICPLPTRFLDRCGFWTGVHVLHLSSIVEPIHFQMMALR
jgi:hypothetical protein